MDELRNAGARPVRPFTVALRFSLHSSFSSSCQNEGSPLPTSPTAVSPRLPRPLRPPPPARLLSRRRRYGRRRHRALREQSRGGGKPNARLLEFDSGRSSQPATTRRRPARQRSPRLLRPDVGPPTLAHTAFAGQSRLRHGERRVPTSNTSRRRPALPASGLTTATTLALAHHLAEQQRVHLAGFAPECVASGGSRSAPRPRVHRGLLAPPAHEFRCKRRFTARSRHLGGALRVRRRDRDERPRSHVPALLAAGSIGAAGSGEGHPAVLVGTGGCYVYGFERPQPNVEAQASVHGVLHLTLRPDGYDWEFIAVPGAGYSDRGSGPCH